jgi:hypothetical protein
MKDHDWNRTHPATRELRMRYEVARMHGDYATASHVAGVLGWTHAAAECAQLDLEQKRKRREIIEVLFPFVPWVEKMVEKFFTKKKK